MAQGDHCWICAGLGDPYDDAGCHACGATAAGGKTHQTPDDAARHARIAAAIEAALIEAGRRGAGWPKMTSWPRSRRETAGFTDDLRGLSRAGQIARVQAMAREHGDRLTEAEAGQALSLYTAEVSGDSPARGRYAGREAGS
jgi:hypothetical protein